MSAQSTLSTFRKAMQLHGGGLSIRAFIHIKDVVRATLKLASKESQELVGTSQQMKV